MRRRQRDCQACGAVIPVDGSHATPTARQAAPNVRAVTAVTAIWLRMLNALSTPIEQHNEYMRLALCEAEAALAEGEVPIGAVVVHEDSLSGVRRIVAAAHNQREQLRDPTAHAEMIAITQAAEALGNWRLAGCTLYVTLEPCPMCAGAIVLARLPRLVYGASDPKAGAVATLFRLVDDPRLNHRADVVGGVLAEPCSQMLSQFFRQKRRVGQSFGE